MVGMGPFYRASRRLLRAVIAPRIRYTDVRGSRRRLWYDAREEGLPHLDGLAPICSPCRRP